MARGHGSQGGCIGLITGKIAVVGSEPARRRHPDARREEARGRRAVRAPETWFTLSPRRATRVVTGSPGRVIARSVRRRRYSVARADVQRTSPDRGDHLKSSVAPARLGRFVASCCAALVVFGVAQIVPATNAIAAPKAPPCPSVATAKVTLGGSAGALSSATKPASAGFGFTTLTCRHGYSTTGDEVMFEWAVSASQFSHWYPSTMPPKGMLSGLGGPAFWDKYAALTKTREFQVFASAPPYVVMVESAERYDQ